ncbi:SRPBCC domain-containing protein [Arthrobacter sp.]|uniref:SRPBCC domain-containing protein n=1 Tax=Arthrobacter sp. TaxID=1667 RepID=UPI00289D3A2B|nr:SRPBCC domain-containing protein [Arthrobacter sp.]
MSELNVELSETERSFGLRQIPAGHARMLVIGRCLPQPIGEVWNALTDPARIGAYFAEPQGDFRRGGDYELPGFSRGTILRCDPPRLLTVSWMPAHGNGGELEIHLADENGATRVELLYASVRKRFAVMDPEVNEWAAGPGWEFFLDNLSAHLDGREVRPTDRDWQSMEGTDRELYEARNTEWVRVREEFEREHSPLPSPE